MASKKAPAKLTKKKSFTGNVEAGQVSQIIYLTQKLFFFNLIFSQRPNFKNTFQVTR